jgi:uncharacterized protein (DUF2164 family)
VAITLPAETRKRAIASIRRYSIEAMEEEIGNLKAGLLLDFLLREIGPSIYNHAIRDAQTYFQEKTGDLDGSCYESEFSYWT